MMRKANGPVYVKLTRPEGYEDACEQIVIEDAEIHPGFMPEPATEEVERLQAEVRAADTVIFNTIMYLGQPDADPKEAQRMLRDFRSGTTKDT